MKKNERFHIKIEDMGENGEGIGRADGYTLFVKGALIGDEIEGVCVKAKKTYGWGRLLRVVRPGPDRVAARCPVAEPCGGCQMQCLSYEAQLTFKQNKVREDLLRIGRLPEEEVRGAERPIIGADDPWRYRNKVQVPFSRGRDGKAVYGFYAGRTHSVIPRDDCFLEPEDAGRILETVRLFMDEHHIPAYDETDGTGLLRHVLIRTSRAEGTVLICLIVNAETPGAFPHLDDLVSRLSELPGAAAVTMNLNTARTNVILGEETMVLSGNGYISEQIDGLRFRISTRSFFQVNTAQAERLYRAAVDAAGLSGREEVWDLYCGTGSISLYAARSAGAVHGVEIVEDAVRDARVNAAENHIENVDFVCGRSEVILPEAAARGVSADVIIVDPPRKGCAPELLDAIGIVSPDRLVYVSCDPATLARDLSILRAKGYTLVSWQPVDMFPQTVHVETVCLMSRVEGK